MKKTLITHISRDQRTETGRCSAEPFRSSDKIGLGTKIWGYSGPRTWTKNLQILDLTRTVINIANIVQIGPKYGHGIGHIFITPVAQINVDDKIC